VTALQFDPLKIIFEKHFYESKEKDVSAFADIVVKDYLNYLKCSGAIIPDIKESLIKSEVKEEVMEFTTNYLGRCTSIKKFMSEMENVSDLKDCAQKRYLELSKELA
jgi:hypothetical protein